MKSMAAIPASLLAILLGPFATGVRADDDAASLKVGAAIHLDGQQGIVTKLDTLPMVESDYTKRFKFDAYENPKLKELREHYKLDEVVAPGKTEFDRQVLLLDWVNHQFKKFGAPTANPRGAAEILHDIEKGDTFFCAQYADVLASTAASLGWVDRTLALRRPEIWSNQFRKWVMLDPTFAMYVEKAGVPLNAYEIRQEWFYHDAKDIEFVVDKDRKRYHKTDMPIFRQRFAGFGDLSLDPGAVNPYAFIGYVPNTNLMDAGPDYGRMFIVKDKLCDGTNWHVRVNPANPAVDPYFPIGQAALSLVQEGNYLSAKLKTMTPNFKSYLVRTDGGSWKSSGDTVAWQVHPGANRLEAKTVNLFGVEGPISTAEVQIGADAKVKPAE
jgi:hypothetical protein